MSRSSTPTVPPTTEEKLRAETRKLGAVQEISQALSSTIDVDELLSLMMTKMTEIVGADRSTLYLISEDGKELWSNIQKGGALHEIRLKIGEGIAGAVAASGETINIRDAYEDDRFQPSIDKRSGYKTKSILCVPMRNTVGEIVGVLQLLNKKGDEFFRREDAELLAAIASQAALAVERSQLYQTLIDQNQELTEAQGRLQERTESLNILYDIERQISDSRDLEDLLRRLVSRAMDMLSAASASIALADSDSGELRFRVVMGQFDESLVGKLVSQNNVERTNGTVATARLEEEGEFFGVLEVADKINEKRGHVGFSAQDSKMLALIAGRLAHAIRISRSKSEQQKQARLAGIGGMLSGLIHDLKTPMTIISGFAQLMASSDSAETREKYVGQIREQFERTSAMTKEVLAFARGETTILVRKVYLHKFLETVATQLEHSFRGLNIVLNMRSEYTGVAYFDENSVLRLIHNLASNATDEMKGGGEFEVGCFEDNEWVRFEFRDNGGGIPKALEGRLFETFATGKSHGTGLGLAIVKKIVDDHGGRIDYQSSDQGTVFRIWLSRDRPTSTPEAGESKR